MGKGKSREARRGRHGQLSIAERAGDVMRMRDGTRMLTADVAYKMERYKRRVSMQAPINTPEWRRVRQAVLHAEPWCRVCAMIGVKTKATEIDHVVARNKGGAIYDTRNLQPLCGMHHKSKTRLADGMEPQRDGFTMIVGPDGFPVRMR